MVRSPFVPLFPVLCGTALRYQVAPSPLAVGRVIGTQAIGDLRITL